VTRVGGVSERFCCSVFLLISLLWRHPQTSSVAVCLHHCRLCPSLDDFPGGLLNLHATGRMRNGIYSRLTFRPSLECSRSHRNGIQPSPWNGPRKNFQSLPQSLRLLPPEAGLLSSGCGSAALMRCWWPRVTGCDNWRHEEVCPALIVLS